MLINNSISNNLLEIIYKPIFNAYYSPTALVNLVSDWSSDGRISHNPPVSTCLLLLFATSNKKMRALQTLAQMTQTATSAFCICVINSACVWDRMSNICGWRFCDFESNQIQTCTLVYSLWFLKWTRLLGVLQQSRMLQYVMKWHVMINTQRRPRLTFLTCNDYIATRTW